MYIELEVFKIWPSHFSTQMSALFPVFIRLLIVGNPEVQVSRRNLSDGDVFHAFLIRVNIKVRETKSELRDGWDNVATLRLASTSSSQSS